MKKVLTNCDRCDKLCKNATTVNMAGDGPVGADLMFVGEAPGREEDECGRPFVGRAGRWLRKQMLMAAGIDQDAVFMTNACRCRPPGNKTPTKVELRNCRDKLVEDIKRVRPKVIVLLGNAPLASLLYMDKVGGITKWRGKPMWSREFGCWIIATFHPSALMRDKGMGISYRHDLAVDDLELAVQLVSRKPPVQGGDRWKTRHLSDVWHVRKFLAAARVSGMVSVDLETDGFRPTNDILGVSMCYKSELSRYYSVYIEWPLLVSAADVKAAFIEILQDAAVRKVFHNVAFDEKFLHYHGCPVGENVVDTMMAAHLLDENFSAGLKENAWRYLAVGGYDIGLDMYKYDQKFKKGQSYAGIPVDIMAPYAAMDALATYQLWEVLEPKLREEGSFSLFNKVLIPVRRILTQVEITGFAVNLDQARVIEDRCVRAKEVLIQKIYAYAGREFDIASAKQLGTVLFDELGLTPIGETKTGQRSVDAATLRAVATQRKRGAKIAEYILKYKYIEKLRGTYIVPVQKNVWSDRRVRSSFRMTGTVTGRASNADPCTHNIPKDQLIRSLYRASDGCVLVEADIKAAELRAVALYSGEQVFLDAFARGENIHKVTYRTIFGKADDYEPTQDEYRLAKTINFGLIYGISPVGLAGRTGLTKVQAQDFMRQYFERLPMIAAWLRRVVRDAKKTGYVESLFKRRRRLPDIQGDDESVVRRCSRQACNAPIQSAAADYTYIGLVRVARAIKNAGLRAKIVHTVHDCIVVDTPADEVDVVREIILTAFETPVTAFPLKMEVDVVVGAAWGEENESNLERLFQDIKV